MKKRILEKIHLYIEDVLYITLLEKLKPLENKLEQSFEDNIKGIDNISILVKHFRTYEKIVVPLLNKSIISCEATQKPIGIESKLLFSRRGHTLDFWSKTNDKISRKIKLKP